MVVIGSVITPPIWTVATLLPSSASVRVRSISFPKRTDPSVAGPAWLLPVSVTALPASASFRSSTPPVCLTEKLAKIEERRRVQEEKVEEWRNLGYNIVSLEPALKDAKVGQVEKAVEELERWGLSLSPGAEAGG